MDLRELTNIDLKTITTWLTTTGLQILVIIIVAFISYRLLIIASRQITLRIQALDDEKDSPQDLRAETFSRLIRTSGLVVIITVAVLMILDQVGINIGPLIASVGVASLALGLGAQTLVKDVIGGLFLIIEDQYHIGDVIEVGGTIGTVENMTLRVTNIRDINGYIHFIPNGEVRVVANRSRDWSRAIIEVGITYEDDLDGALSLLQEIGDGALEDSEIGPLILEQPVVTGVEGLDDWQVRLRLMVKTVAGTQFDVQRYLRAKIRYKFPARGITLASPRQEVVLLQNG